MVQPQEVSYKYRLQRWAFRPGKQLQLGPTEKPYVDNTASLRSTDRFSSACTCLSDFLLTKEITVLYMYRSTKLVSHHIMEPRFSTCRMLHWTPHITSSFIHISWRYGFTDNTTTGLIVVKEAKNSSTYSRLYQRQEAALPSGTRGCPFSTFWGLQQKQGMPWR
jgi:hypothetical protein